MVCPGFYQRTASGALCGWYNGAMTTRLLMTEREYLDTLANSNRFEFCNGVVTEKRGEFMTKRKPVAAAEEVSAALRAYRLAHGGFAGQTPTTNLSGGSDRIYRMPDHAYWGPHRAVGESIFQPPTLAVELVSEDQSVPDLRKKCRFYREHGIPVVWLIDPQRETVEVFEGAVDGAALPHAGVLESKELPGFSLPLEELWAAIA